MAEALVRSVRSTAYRWLAVLGTYALIAFVIPRPAALTPGGWRVTALFIATILGLILEPMPGGAVVLIAVTAAMLFGILPIKDALAGYADATVWLVLAAFFISRALINTGLARRIALLFVRRFGQSSLGVAYALAASDVALATIIPSSGARSGGVILPIARSIAELYGSQPGATSRLLGSYLMMAIYQGVCIGCAMFLTGQASNPLAARFAAQQGFTITWGSWLLAGIVPGLLSLLIVPWVVMKIHPPEIQRTPEAPEFARSELAKMGPMSRAERILAVVFAAVCLLWVTSGQTGLDITVVALAGSVALLVTGVLTWEDVRSERSAWDTFLWYGGLYMLGKALNDTKAPTVLAQSVGVSLGNLEWSVLFAVTLLIYFYAHYGFASITTHILAMFPAFLSVLLAKGAPIGLMAFGFATFANLAAGLTNYGTTPGPMFFAQGYVSMGQWWKVGFWVSLINILIWATVGFGWWKVIGVW